MDATLRITGKPAHEIPRTLYGHFVEHLGRCVKGGLWAPGEEEDMFLGGVRRGLLDTAKSLRPSVIRYPGGCFADGYHWRDGVGPREKRPRRKNRMWGKLGPAIGPAEDNHFGTDEFLAFCEAVGAAPMLTVNVGSGTPKEAAEWIEYTNGATSSPMGALRAAHGHPEPYGVNYWFVGNEIFGSYEIGHLTPAEYAKVFLEFAAAMRETDPGVKLIACGSHFPAWRGFMDLNRRKEINRLVLEGAGEEADYLSIHQYAPPPGPGALLRYQLLGRHRSAAEGVYYGILETHAQMRRFLEQCIEDTKNFSPGSAPVPLVLDEWNLWLRFFSDIVQSNFTLRDGLWAATILNLLHELAALIPIANIAQLVNVMGVINSSPKGTYLTPVGLAMALYAEKAGNQYLPAGVSSPALKKAGDLPALDASATCDKGRLALFLVNRHYHEPLQVRVELGPLAVSPQAHLTWMRHANVAQSNTSESPTAVTLESEETTLEPKDGSLALTLEPHSLVCVEMPLTT